MNALVTLLIESLHTASCGLTHPEEYPPNYGQDVMLPNEPLEFDFVVVGACTAGSVVVSRLSENPKWNILLLEAGGNPVAESEGLECGFACKAFEDDRCSWIQGKGLGGSGSINGLVHLNGFAQDFDSWRELGNPGSGYKDLQPYIEKIEKNHGNSSHPMGFLDLDNFEGEVEGSQVQNMIYQQLIHNRGPLLTIGVTRLVGFVKSHLNLTKPDLEMHHMFFRAGNILGLNTLLTGLGLKSEYKNFVVNLVKSQVLLMMALSLVQPKSRGLV
ncbi:uncharacterized protein LOC133326754 [Musca vetustissima]|uniref:uncharacterized protein LOC133326754 n=1 Tax=Musca vetustissima TaxID=27455 RepID=UPI002AB755D8|nr:uncharacterized protein LOC133326754 [Musca vetustissima]